jgi:peptidoglycan/LPS O-acetylase OafA/YrhL
MTYAPVLAPGASERATQGSVYRPELDLLRFLAFFGVFLFHTIDYPITFYVQHDVPLFFAEVLNALAVGGKYGVSLFFVLSSYLITDLLIREKEVCGSLDVRYFYLRRILRIWPLYYFLLLATLTIPLFDPTHVFGLRYLLPFLALSGNWAFVAFGGIPTAAVSPLWSVSVEEQFYLIWPPIVARLSRRQMIYAAWSMILVGNITRVVILLYHPARPIALWANTFAHFDEIAAGILMAIYLRGRAPSISNLARMALVVGGAICIIFRGHIETVTNDSVSWGTTLLGWPMVATSCSAILFGFIGLQVASPWFQYLGKISYGLYAYHMFSVLAVDQMLAMQHRVREHTLPHLVLRWFLSFGLTIAVSAVSYSLLEKPFLKLKEKFTRVRSRPV